MVSRAIVLISIIVLIFSACRKEEEELHQVSYVVIETSNDSPQYSVKYAADNGNTKVVGGITEASWSSESIMNKKRGDFVSLTVESPSAAGAFVARIYFNGVLFLEDKMYNPHGPITISGNLPR